jgi:phosphonate transport system substrate-binding protein
LLDLEGLKAWLPGRTDGYKQLEAAVDLLHFYDREGNVVAGDYRP